MKTSSTDSVFNDLTIEDIADALDYYRRISNYYNTIIKGLDDPIPNELVDKAWDKSFGTGGNADVETLLKTTKAVGKLAKLVQENVISTTE